MKCLDSDFLVAVLRGDKRAKFAFDGLKKEEVAITAINAFELYVGAYLSKRIENISTVISLINSCIFLNFERNSARIAGKISADLESKGKLIGWRDCMIAAIALSNGCSIITRNTKHFSKIKELKIEKW